MLTGQNGILTNATNANSTNVYRSAEEQVKLAYMSVKTEIMTKTVANSTYDATSTDNVTALAEIVKKDLNTTKTVAQVTEGTAEGFGVTANTTDKTIDIIYKNSKIYAETISSETPKAPKHNGYVTYKITLGEQSAGLIIDEETVSEVSDSGSGGSGSGGGSTVNPTAGIGAVNNTYKGDFGKKVSGYNPSQGSNWRLFYADSTSAYLIADSIGNKALNSLSGWNSSTLTESNVSELGKNLNSKFTAWETNPNYNNKKGVAALLDTTKWTDYAETGVATWAIGAPTLEMFVASYNATHTTQIGCDEVTDTGYKVNKNGGEYDNGQIDFRESGKESLDNAIYCPSSGDWWLASPSANTTSNYVMVVGSFGSGALGGGGYNGKAGVRPLVSVPIYKIENGITITSSY